MNRTNERTANAINSSSAVARTNNDSDFHWNWCRLQHYDRTRYIQIYMHCADDWTVVNHDHQRTKHHHKTHAHGFSNLTNRTTTTTNWPTDKLLLCACVCVCIWIMQAVGLGRGIIVPCRAVGLRGINQEEFPQVRQGLNVATPVIAGYRGVQVHPNVRGTQRGKPQPNTTGER